MCARERGSDGERERASERERETEKEIERGSRALPALPAWKVAREGGEVGGRGAERVEESERKGQGVRGRDRVGG